MKWLIIILLLVIISYIIKNKSNNIEKFIENINSNKLIPYRQINNFVDNKKLQKNLDNHCTGKINLILDNNDNLDINNSKDDTITIRHYIGIQCLRYNPVLYLSKKAYKIEGNNFIKFNFFTNHKNTLGINNFDINNYYRQLYSKLNFVFFQLNEEICNNTTEFTVLTLDIEIGKNNNIYLKQFKYFIGDSPDVKKVENIYNDLYSNQINDNYIKIYPKKNTYDKY